MKILNSIKDFVLRRKVKATIKEVSLMYSEIYRELGTDENCDKIADGVIYLKTQFEPLFTKISKIVERRMLTMNANNSRIEEDAGASFAERDDSIDI